MKNLVAWWKGSSTNEKLMYALIVILLIGIIARFDYIKSELADTVNTYKDRMNYN